MHALIAKTVSVYIMYQELSMYVHISSQLYTVPQNAPTLSSFNKHGLILIFLVNSISTLSKMVYLFNFTCPFNLLTVFAFKSSDGNDEILTSLCVCK